ncbi:MAG: hypothetical protein AAGG02_12535 [Cyanobacteria bacterium P01_H01_bin.15]
MAISWTALDLDHVAYEFQSVADIPIDHPDGCAIVGCWIVYLRNGLALIPPPNRIDQGLTNKKWWELSTVFFRVWMNKKGSLSSAWGRVAQEIINKACTNVED